MTIAICLKVGDGVVLGADSASTMMAGGGVQNVYFNAEKIFNLVKGLPIGAVTYGLGAIGGRSVTSLAKDLRSRLMPHGPLQLDPDSYTMAEVADKVRAFFYEELYRDEFPTAGNPPDALAPQLPAMGFIVAGFSAKSSHPEVWAVEVDDRGACGPPALIFDEARSGQVVWRGQPEALNRLLYGFSEAAGQRLVRAGMTPGEVLNLLAEYAGLANPGMPIQDAIDLVQYLADVTIGYIRFAPGAPTVAPPVDIASITLYEKFRWVKRKHYFAAELNPLQ